MLLKQDDEIVHGELFERNVTFYHYFSSRSGSKNIKPSKRKNLRSEGLTRSVSNKTDADRSTRHQLFPLILQYLRNRWLFVILLPLSFLYKSISKSIQPVMFLPSPLGLYRSSWRFERIPSQVGRLVICTGGAPS